MNAKRSKGKGHGRGRSVWMRAREAQSKATPAISCGIAITPRTNATPIKTTLLRTNTMLGKAKPFQQKQGN
jgi:hypothetical protein